MNDLPIDLSQLPQKATSLRKANIEDFFDCEVDDIPNHHNHDHKHTHNDEYIQKNQRHYGDRKRIKP